MDREAGAGDRGSARLTRGEQPRPSCQARPGALGESGSRRDFRRVGLQSVRVHGTGPRLGGRVDGFRIGDGRPGRARVARRAPRPGRGRVRDRMGGDVLRPEAPARRPRRPPARTLRPRRLAPSPWTSCANGSHGARSRSTSSRPRNAPSATPQGRRRPVPALRSAGSSGRIRHRDGRHRAAAGAMRARRPGQLALLISWPSAIRSGATSSAIRTGFTSATMISPTSVVTPS